MADHGEVHDAGCGARHLRARRILSRAGARLWRMAEAHCWSLFADGDRRKRPLMVLSAAEFQALRGQGCLVAGATDGEWKGAKGLQLEKSRKRLAAAPVLDKEHADEGASARGFVRLAHQAMAGKGPLTLREVQAGRRIAADMEAADATSHVTMNWDGLGTTRAQTSPGGGPHVCVSARQAQRRLSAVSGFVGAQTFNLAVAACLRGRSIAALERAFELPARTGRMKLAQALARIADAYDLAAPPDKSSG